MTDLDLVTWLRTQLDWQEDVATRARDADKAADRLFAGHCSPTWTLREVEAKRRIVAACEPDHADSMVNGDDTAELATEVLRLLALPFAVRPGYRAEWKP